MLYKKELLQTAMLLNLRRYMRLIPSCYEGDPVVAAAYNY